MASYAAVSTNDTAQAGADRFVLGIVVTDGQQVRVFESVDGGLGLGDIEWPTGEPHDVLRAGLANLYYFTVDGPHDFADTDGGLDEAAKAIAASYGLG